MLSVIGSFGRGFDSRRLHHHQVFICAQLSEDGFCGCMKVRVIARSSRVPRGTMPLDALVIIVLRDEDFSSPE